MWIAIQNAIGARQGVGGGPGPTPPPYTPPMDAYPADIAYSVRLVNGTYSGPCIEAYRVSDGATQDIGFDSFGRVSATELAAFSSGSVLEVQTWYDQMPGANHAVATVNTTTGTLTRAIVYDGSSIVTDGIEPALDFVNPVDFPTLRFSNIGVASGYESFQVTNAATNNGGTPLYVTSTGYNFNHHQPISYPNGNVYDGFGSNARPAFLGIGYPNMYMQHVYNTTAGPKNVRINNVLVGTSSAAANVGSLSHYISAMARTQVGDVPAGRYTGYIKELFIYKAIQTSGMRDALTSNINSFYQIGNFPDYTSGFLADYPNAAAAYSVRKLSNTAIKCMRVRRAVAPFDEKDIGFTAGGGLDEAAIVAFGGSDVLLVSAWYDQSGQSNHATQTTPGSQPQIYNGTSVITENGKPCIDYDSTGGDSFNMATSIEVVTSIHVIKGESGTGFEQYVLGASSGLDWYSNLGQLVNQNSAAGQNTTLHLDGASVNPYIARPTTQSLAFFNWTTGSGTTSQITQDRGTSSRSWKGTYQELILYTSDQSSNRTGIETNINDYYEVYPTSGFLVDHPNAQASYSLRQLQNLQQYAIEVERHSDNATLDIGFVGVDLDEQAIIDFAQGGVVGVRGWYDQNHNSSRDLVQTNTANQPLIYSGSALYKVGGKCAIYYDTTTKQLSGNIGGTGNPVDIFNVHQRVSGSGYFLHWESSGGFQVATMQTNYKLGWLGGTTGPALDTDQHLFTVTANGTTGQIRLDGAASTAGTLSASRTFNSKFAIQGRPDFPGANPGPVIYQQEFIQYDFNHSAGDLSNIETDIQTYYSIP